MSAQSKPVQQLTPFGYALAGALGGCFSSAVVYPLDVVKTRIQASTQEKSSGRAPKGILPLLLSIAKLEGIAGFYKGFAATMLNTFSQQYAYFFFYSFVRLAYIKRRTTPGGKPPTLSTAAELLLGAIAGALAQIFTIPVSVIATRQQVSSGKTRINRFKRTTPDGKETWVEEEEPVDESFWAVGKQIVDEEGPTGLWLGIKPGLVLTVNPAITYGVFERVKSILLIAQEKAGQTNGKLTPGRNFLVGALSKTLATVVTYPYIMAKVRIQTRPSEKEEKSESLPHPSSTASKSKNRDGAVDLLKTVYQKEGLIGWYQGMGAQILKAVLSQALLFMSKDQFEQWALVIMAFLYTVKSKRT